MLSNRIAQLRPTAVNAVLAEVRQLQAQGRELVSLMRGEPDLATPAHIVEAASAAMARGRTGYPDNRGEMNFREAVAAKLQRDNGLQFDAGTEILATSGATFGLYAALAALVNPGDEVLIPDPIYDAYYSPIRLAGGEVRPVAATISQGRFALDVNSLERAAGERAKVLILNTPWNPVGTVLSRREVANIAEFCIRRNITLISDEIYEAITYEGLTHISPLAAAPGLRDLYIHVNSLSKTYAMTGWRVGYCAGPKAIIDAMLLVLAQSSRGPATFVQDAAAAALAGPQDAANEMVEEYTLRRELVIRTLAGIPGVKVLAPEGGFFAMLDVSGLGMPSNEVRKRLLDDAGVVVIHGAAYGPTGEGTLRVSFASGGAILQNGLARLRQGLEGMGAAA